MNNSPAVASDTPTAPDIPAKCGRLRIRSAHLVGIAGSGMRALAELIHGSRVCVTGSDQHIPHHVFWEMHQAGLLAFQGHAASQLPPEADVLIYSPVIPADNPERREATRLGIQQLSLSEAIGRIMAGRVGLSVTGTHGKTSTTALVGHLFDVGGQSPSVLTGGEVCGRGASGWAGRGRLFVAESCEYRRHFLDLAPQHAILLNIEPDHFDCFGTLRESIDTFREFTARLPKDGKLLVNYDSPAAMEAASGTGAKVRTFGSRAGADWWLGGLRQTSDGWRFPLFYRSKLYGQFDLPLPGRHNVLNAVAAIAMCCRLGVSRQKIAEGLQSFRGVKRRFELLGTPQGVTLIDDYAHHPTAIRATLRTAREQYGARRIWCAFQPHQVSRTRALFGEFVRSLSLADRVLISPVFAAREPASEDQSRLSAEMAKRVRRSGTPARLVESLGEITSVFESEARSGDVFLTLGAGDISRIGRDVMLQSQRQRAS